MGRGRAKAKQTKVARELKYRNGGTDLGALRAELAGVPPPTRTTPSVPAPDELDDDVAPELLYDGRYDVPDDDEDDEDDSAPARRQV